jgi:hypothetical protein
MTAETSGRGRSDRLISACEAAIDRLETREASGISPDVFDELGESLFWLCALAEERGRSSPLIKGLTWARNRVTHGSLVAAPVDWHYGAELGRLILGRAQLGTTSGHEWMDRSQIGFGPRDRPAPKQEQAYDEAVAGQRVVGLLRQALSTLR